MGKTLRRRYTSSSLFLMPIDVVKKKFGVTRQSLFCFDIFQGMCMWADFSCRMNINQANDGRNILVVKVPFCRIVIPLCQWSYVLVWMCDALLYYRIEQCNLRFSLLFLFMQTKKNNLKFRITSSDLWTIQLSWPGFPFGSLLFADRLILDIDTALGSRRVVPARAFA